MMKPADLREHLSKTVRHLAINPDKLALFIDEGKLIATAGKSLSFEYQYTLNLIIQDYADHPDTIMVPVLAWVSTNQPELFSNVDKRQNGITFEADILNHDTIDLSIKINLTERVVVREVDGKPEIKHYGEPPLDEYAGLNWALFLRDQPWPVE
ncbi:phage tail protein [Iodobacter ciconiae]|uniref:Phage tail protein n=1 Tax=Iodobacter ciconiae TaxID=2496266 RepID=A0A3S8ZPZ7_9NEIS|nr:phage tail protein [Iodobacter ciconiae]AZN35534.1 phage tail protein [Iodobacter ciconiae]